MGVNDLAKLIRNHLPTSDYGDTIIYCTCDSAPSVADLDDYTNYNAAEQRWANHLAEVITKAQPERRIACRGCGAHVGQACIHATGDGDVEVPWFHSMREQDAKRIEELGDTCLPSIGWHVEPHINCIMR